MVGEEGVIWTQFLFPRELQRLDGVQSESAGWCSSVDCSIISVRGFEAPDWLLTAVFSPPSLLHTGQPATSPK